VTVSSLIVGVGLASLLSGRRFPGRGALKAAAASMLAALPACLALGVLGLWGTASPWPWPASMGEAVSGRPSLETWQGLPSWALWIWTTLPSAAALVILATAAALERVEPAWHDAARLAGAGPIRTWRTVTWPLIRPAAVRAAAIVFPLALVEPGAPLILGLRRTLAFQIVETASRPEPFPRLTVWAAMAAVFAFVGRWLLRWWGGPPLLGTSDEPRGRVRPRVPTKRAGAPAAVACVVALAGSVALGWLPVLGLGRVFWALGQGPGAPSDATGPAPGAMVRRAVEPPVPQLLTQSVLLGIEVGAGVLCLAWLLRPDPGERHPSTLASRIIGRFAQMPPLVQGVGLLALPRLLEAALLRLEARPGLAAPVARISGLARAWSVDRNPWEMLVAAVGVSVGVRLLQNWRRVAGRQPDETRSGLDAARLVGSSSWRTRAVASLRPRRWIGAISLAFVLAATNLAPALLFAPWMDGRTLAPAMIALADGPDDLRLQAAALAVCLIAGNLAGLVAARLAPSPPPEWDPDPP
jgi:iron(III) transport system permease protein